MTSSIEWLGDPFLGTQGDTWNPWRGCTRVGPECDSCYIVRTIPFRTIGMDFDKPGIGGTTGIVYASRAMLFKPLSRQQPLLYFPCSVTDLWHEQVAQERIAEVWAVMLLARWHIFQTCTKRGTRQCRLLNSAAFADLVAEAVERIAVELGPRRVRPADLEHARAHLAERLPGGAMRPLPNVWIGVTAGCNQSVKTRIPYLSRTPAEVRWVSSEPFTDEGDGDEDGLTFSDLMLNTVDYVIFGGESGARHLVAAEDTGPGTRLRRLSLPRLQHLLHVTGQARGGAIARSVKQLGTPWAVEHRARHPKGGDWSEWPADLRIREYPPQLAQRALRVDPGNEPARAYLAGREPEVSR